MGFTEEWYKNGIHPKGNLGKKHSKKTGRIISRKLKAAWKKGKFADRKGEVWNKGLTKETNTIIAKYAEVMTGKKFTKEHIENMSKAQKGNIPWNKGIYTSKTKKWYHRLRKTVAYYKWRESVFKRDNWTCQKCGIRGGYLEPHHIISIKDDKSKALLISNGITLCRECHKKITWPKK